MQDQDREGMPSAACRISLNHKLWNSNICKAVCSRDLCASGKCIACKRSEHLRGGKVQDNSKKLLLVRRAAFKSVLAAFAYSQTASEQASLVMSFLSTFRHRLWGDHLFKKVLRCRDKEHVRVTPNKTMSNAATYPKFNSLSFSSFNHSIQILPHKHAMQDSRALSNQRSTPEIFDQLRSTRKRAKSALLADTPR